MTISGIPCYEKNGTAYLNLEAVARGLGFTYVATSGNEVVRWKRVEGYLKELGVATCGYDEYIPESVFYRLAMKAKNEVAEAFQAKIAEEVIPSIRKHGAYMTQETLEAAILNPDYLLKVATALKAETDKRKALEAKVSADAPKVLFADSVAASSSTVLVGELAKIMRQNGVDMGERRLFRWMRDNGYLIKRNGTDYNMPTQASMEQGLFRIKETVINHSDGHTSVSKTPKVTGKGQTFFLNKFLGEGKTV
ncbi:MAG: phage antirepressor KilAC domain-containing protein [Firmicutes bacterium]|nr:phage antirepressor KilAC domain-containing protein [Bacillota bacterium]